MKLSDRMLLGTALAVSAMAPAQAGVYAETADREIGSDEPPTVQRLYVQGGMFRSEQSDDDSYSIFRDGKMYVVDPGKRRYRVVDKAAMDALGARMAQMRKQMEKELANMPAAQRAQMERMMPGMGLAGPSAPPAVYKIKDAGRTDKAAGRTCRVYETAINGAPDDELCVVPAASLPGGGEFQAVTQAMADLMSSLEQQLNPGGKRGSSTWFGEVAKIKGVPVRIRSFDARRKPDSETLLTTWRTESIPALKFEVPKGYKLISMDAPD